MTTPDPIRTALKRLIKLDDAHEGDRQWEPWVNAIEAACVALAAAPEGELGERDRISIDGMCEILRSLEIKATEYTDCTILYEVTFDQLRAICNTRAATLLEQLSAVAPAVVPIPVSERLPGAEDCHFSPGAVIGSCWCFNPVEHLGGIAWWSFEPLEWSESATHWLPAHALPLPTTTPAGQEEA